MAPSLAPRMGIPPPTQSYPPTPTAWRLQPRVRQASPAATRRPRTARGRLPDPAHRILRRVGLEPAALGPARRGRGPLADPAGRQQGAQAGPLVGRLGRTPSTRSPRSSSCRRRWRTSPRGSRRSWARSSRTSSSRRSCTSTRASTSARYHPVTAQVILRDPTLWYQTIEIDKGSVDGVACTTRCWPTARWSARSPRFRPPRRSSR